MKNFKNGFTLAEMLICLVVAGALAAMLIPSVVHNKPDKNKAMYRKAYYIVERVAAEMTMDEETFPADENGSRGFAYFLPNDEVDNNAPIPRTQANTGRFFCSEFARKISTNGEINCTDAKAVGNDNAVNDDISFSTNDGVRWYVTPNIICDPEDAEHNPAADPDNPDANPGSPCNMPALDSSGNPPCPDSVGTRYPYICLFVDVNGPELPNRMVNTFVGTPANETARDELNKEADRAWFYVYYNGKVQAPAGQAARYLKSTTVF